MSESRGSFARIAVTVVVVAAVAAVASALIQKWISGDVNPAVTGGVVGGLTAVVLARTSGGKRREG